MAVLGYTVLEAAGTVTLLYIGLKAFWRVWQTVRIYLLSGPLGLSLNFRKYAGKWAVVTGSTDGIGKAYAEELAARGLNIVLISRTEDKLKAVAAEIEANVGVQTKIVVADFGSTDIYENIKKELDGLDVVCLVNNVGYSPNEYPEYFLNLDAERYDKAVNVNIMSVIKMTWVVLPGMVERKKGVILNIASVSGVVPVPLLAVYGGTKAFVVQFSRSLAVEYKDKGIIVQTVTPGFVATKMVRGGSLRPGFFTPSPETFVRSALNTVGLVGETSGCLGHTMQMWAVSFFPQEMYSSRALLPSRLKTRDAILKARQDKKEN